MSSGSGIGHIGGHPGIQGDGKTADAEEAAEDGLQRIHGDVQDIPQQREPLGRRPLHRRDKTVERGQAGIDARRGRVVRENTDPGDPEGKAVALDWR